MGFEAVAFAGKVIAVQIAKEACDEGAEHSQEVEGEGDVACAGVALLDAVVADDPQAEGLGCPGEGTMGLVEGGDSPHAL